MRLRRRPEKNIMLLERIKRWFQKDPRAHLCVVEDDPQVRQLIGIHLKALGFRATMAVDAASALDLIDRQGQRFALFLLDVKLPGENGVQLAREIRRRPGFSNVPILFVTGVFTPSELARVKMQIPLSDAINKPFSQSQLREAIHGMIAPEEKKVNV